MTTGKVYCTAPWNGVTIRENGDVRTCCQGNTILGNLNNSSIQEILKSDKAASIRNKMIGGLPDSHNCKTCIHDDATSGLAALRQHYLNYYPNIYKETRFKNIDIRWNNSCNLGCVYCSPTFSSTWQNRLNIEPVSPVKNYQDKVLEFIISKVDELEEIMLVGGEPMLMKQNQKLFKKISKDAKISIITNLSYDLEKLPSITDLLDRPANNTIWSVSLENTGQQFEYVRNGASWDQVEKNLKFLNKHWPNTSSVLMVYSVLSAFNIHQTISILHSLGIKKFTFQSYFGPRSMNVFHMPPALQKIAYNSLIQARDFHYSQLHVVDIDLYKINNIDFLLDTLKNSSNQSTLSPISKIEFFNQTEQYNQWNKTQFCDLWPDVVDLVNQHLL
jgi:radical SAM protein with 4Fe4S-binding SPASM domain